MDTLRHALQGKLMARALTLAKRGLGRTSPNPMVGCVVARGDRIVGEGFHIFERRDHAEVAALAAAGREARGADLYVNLEPCAHYGRTPPCTDLIVSSGVKRVFVSIEDPNPEVAGRGIALLRKNGIEVHLGLLNTEATRLNEAFLHFIQRGAPFALLKLALTLDGKIATGRGDSRWITGEKARLRVHRLRYEYDAILAGVGTVLKDNPSLDVRWRRRNSICKVVLDSRLRTPPHAKLFQSGDPVVVFHASDAPQSRRRLLEKNALLIEAPRRDGLLSWPEILARLARRKIMSLIVEGGSQVAASALRAGVIQKINFFYGPKILGGRDLSGVGDLGIETLSDAIQLTDTRITNLAPDFLLEARLEPARKSS